MFHQPSLAWMKYSRKLRGKMGPGEMYKKLKKHPKVGVESTKTKQFEKAASLLSSLTKNW